MSLLELYYKAIREFLRDQGISMPEGRVKSNHPIVGAGKAVYQHLQEVEFARVHPEIIAVCSIDDLTRNRTSKELFGFPVGTKTTRVLASQDLIDTDLAEDLLSLRSDVWLLGDRLSFLAMSDLSSYRSCMSSSALYPRRESILQWVDSNMVMAVQISRKTAEKSARQLIWLTGETAVLFPCYGGKGSNSIILGVQEWLKEHGYRYQLDVNAVSIEGHFWNDQPIEAWSKKPEHEVLINVTELVCPLCGYSVNEHELNEDYHTASCPECAGMEQCESCGEWATPLVETYDGYHVCESCYEWRTAEVRVLYT